MTSERVVRSALWAAYGDALGFITELADARLVRRRIGLPEVRCTVPWRRRVGGRFGAELELPAGAYSDDTQLRLATGRSMRGDGQFDSETFSKIELPVWLSYSLGGGRGTKAAAANLAKPTVAWFTNFFEAKGASYVQGGGNGAAMRIQPHVWAAREHRISDEIVLDIIRNTLTTHGHMRALVGALFHANCLSVALSEGRLPGPEDWRGILSSFVRIPAILLHDHNLASIWLPTWEERSGRRIDDAVNDVTIEFRELIATVEPLVQGKAVRDTLRLIIDSVGGFSPATRGAGHTTALASAAIAWTSRGESLEETLCLVANFLGSDTDSIATMVGATVGAVAPTDIQHPVLDRSYIFSEAERLHRISTGEVTDAFGYPDVLEWIPPRSQLESVGLIGNSLALAGLGRAVSTGSEFPARANGALWQWLEVGYGQHLPVKRRINPPDLPRNQHPVSRVSALHEHSPDAGSARSLSR